MVAGCNHGYPNPHLLFLVPQRFYSPTKHSHTSMEHRMLVANLWQISTNWLTHCPVYDNWLGHCVTCPPCKTWACPQARRVSAMSSSSSPKPLLAFNQHQANPEASSVVQVSMDWCHEIFWELTPHRCGSHSVAIQHWVSFRKFTSLTDCLLLKKSTWPLPGD